MRKKIRGRDEGGYVVRQGEVYWLDLGVPSGSAPGYRRPYVVVQNDALNESGIHTTVVCALTSNVRRASAAGNVLLREREGGLPRQSAVNVSQMYTVDQRVLSERVGALSRRHVAEIVDGIRLILEPVDL
jgi:mRNA interferase MazF